MKLKVYAILSEDINNGWVWLPEAVVAERIVIKLRNVDSGKSVYCEALPLGENYLRRYNLADTITIENGNRSIVLNEWYRKKLGITSTQGEQEFIVTTADNPYGHINASLSHPQIVMRVAVQVAFLGLVLGIISLWK